MEPIKLKPGENMFDVARQYPGQLVPVVRAEDGEEMYVFWRDFGGHFAKEDKR